MRFPGKVALVGVDGTSLNVLKLVVNSGYAPNLNEVIGNGFTGSLRSIIPPVTGAAWLSMATGLDPGETGVVDFFKRVNGYRLELVSSRDYEGRSIWDYASYHGLRVGVLNYPLLYPPYPVNGFMVSGLGSPGNTPYSWPIDIADKLRDNDALYSVYVDYHLEKYNDLDLFFRDVEDYMKRFARAVKLLADPKLDLFVMVVQASDWVLHRLWAYIFEDHPLHAKLPKEDISKARRWFYEFWSIVNDVVGIVMDKYVGDGVILAVSDHGFGSQYGVFNLVKWLVEKGFMKLRRGTKAVGLRNAILRLGSKIIRLVPHRFRWKIAEKGKKLLAYDISALIDLKNSVAIALGHTIPFGAIYLLNKDRGEEVVAKLLDDLKQLGLKAEMYYPKEIYRGSRAELLPDILFLIEDGRVVVLEELRDLDKPLYVEKPFSFRHTGSHRLEGVVIAYGNNIAKKEGIEASILDIAPTILYLLDLPIPKNLRGKILTSISIPRKEPRYVNEEYYAKLRILFRAKLLKQRMVSKSS